jgi:hypothetical protein
METEIKNGKLYAKADRGNRQWIAKVTGEDIQYGFAREFVAYQKPMTSQRASGSCTIRVGDVIEDVEYTHSGKNRDIENYYVILSVEGGGKYGKIRKEEVLSILHENRVGEK